MVGGRLGATDINAVCEHTDSLRERCALRYGVVVTRKGSTRWVGKRRSACRGIRWVYVAERVYFDVYAGPRESGCALATECVQRRGYLLRRLRTRTLGSVPAPRAPWR